MQTTRIHIKKTMGKIKKKIRLLLIIGYMPYEMKFSINFNNIMWFNKINKNYGSMSLLEPVETRQKKNYYR